MGLIILLAVGCAARTVVGWIDRTQVIVPTTCPIKPFSRGRYSARTPLPSKAMPLDRSRRVPICNISFLWKCPSRVAMASFAETTYRQSRSTDEALRTNDYLEQLGGEATITALLNGLYGRALGDPLFRPFLETSPRKA